MQSLTAHWRLNQACQLLRNPRAWPATEMMKKSSGAPAHQLGRMVQECLSSFSTWGREKRTWVPETSQKGTTQFTSQFHTRVGKADRKPSQETNNPGPRSKEPFCVSWRPAALSRTRLCAERSESENSGGSMARVIKGKNKAKAPKAKRKLAAACRAAREGAAATADRRALLVATADRRALSLLVATADPPAALLSVAKAGV